MRKTRLAENEIKQTKSPRGDILTCEHPPCSKEFRRSGRAIFCSPKCSNAEANARKMRTERVCQNDACRSPFIGKRKYCSEECAVAAIAAANREWVANEFRNCNFCSGWHPSWHLGRRGLKAKTHCSKKCAERSHSVTSMGITIKRFWEMWNEQDGKCQICFCLLEDTSQAEVPWHRHVVIDHDHKTLKIRALLHRRCNLFLGTIESDPQATKNCLIYLEKHSEAV